MTDTLHIGQPPIPVRLRRSARARRFSLRISNADGSVSLTLPKRSSKRAAMAFAAGQEAWLRRNLDKRPAQIELRYGSCLPFDGSPVVLQPGQGRSVKLENDRLSVPGLEIELGPRLRGFLKVAARERMAVAAEHYAKTLGQRVSRITIRDTRSRWGSCTSEGNLMFSWRLVMAPRLVQDYVAAHEVCHLIEMNHSPTYWSLVEEVFPGYQIQRKWLKANGAELHRFRF
ncbi:MAG: M48 family metallopeptidase [Rhodobacteraceae bacterium]|nr:M48 family metallopeptidase [Paracoccaceae bacterium]